MTGEPAVLASQLPEAWQQRIMAAVEAGFPEQVRRLQEAIRINSVNPNHDEGKTPEAFGGESKVSHFLANYMQEAGMAVDIFAAEAGRDNAVGYIGGEGPSLLFNGHVDVVGAGDLSQWRIAKPFGGELIDGKVYGRGATDMKGGLICAIAAAKALRQAGLTPQGRLLIEAVCGEENMDTAAGTGACLERGYRADAGICPEASAPPYASAIDIASPGTLTFELRVQGRAGHTCMRDEICRAGGRGDDFAVSALDKAVFLYEGLHRLEERWGVTKTHPAFTRPGHFTINPGTFAAGPSPFAIPEEACLTYTAWYAPQDTKEAVQAELMEYMEKWCASDPWLVAHPPRFNWLICWPSFNVPADAPICRALADAYQTALGQPAPVYGFAAVADASFLNAAGIPTVIMGPGNLFCAHGADEYVETAQLLEITKVYALAISGWCGVQ